MTEEGRVVVLVSPLVMQNPITNVWIAEILPLGLGAYADTSEEAVAKVKQMVGSAVQARRQLGKLEAWLQRCGVPWYWESDYDGSISVENAGEAPFPVMRLLKGKPNDWVGTNPYAEELVA
ncbi:MAG: hypothetical protein NTZ05_08675 [Chloroflexi bacterium]|nr:hypothetical protein [Chloroflexota bacterium]